MAIGINLKFACCEESYRYAVKLSAARRLNNTARTAWPHYSKQFAFANTCSWMLLIVVIVARRGVY